MNQIFRVIWNDVLCLWQCVSELTSAYGKPSSQHSSSPSSESSQESSHRFPYKSLAGALLIALSGLATLTAHAGATPFQGGYTETIDSSITKNGGSGSYLRAGDPLYSGQGPSHQLITSTGHLTVNNAHFQITSYQLRQSNPYTPNDPDIVAIAGSNVDIDGGKLTMTAPWSWLEIGRTNYGFMNVYNGATVTTPGHVGIGAWRSTTGQLAYVTIDGAGTTFTAGQNFVVGDDGNGFNGAGILNVSNGASLKVGSLKTSNENTHAEIHFDNAKLEVTWAGTFFEKINTVSGEDQDIIDIGSGGLEFTASATGTYTQAANAALSGAGGLTKKGAGTVILEANNTYSGGTHIVQGKVQAGNGGTMGTFGTGAITLDENTTAAINRSDTYTLSNELIGNNNTKFEQNGSGTVIIERDNDQFTGTTIVNAGTLQLGNNTASGSVGTGTIQVSQNATLAINRADPHYTVVNQVTGAGILRKQGTNIISFNHAIDVNKTLVDDGTLEASSTFHGGDVVVGDKNGAPGSAKFVVLEGETVAVNSMLIQSDGQLETKNTSSKLNVTNDLLIDKGQWNLASGSTVTANKTQLKDGELELASGVNLTTSTLEVGDNTGAASSAHFTVSGILTSDNVHVDSDGSLDFKHNTGIRNSLNVYGGAVHVVGNANVSTTVTYLNEGTIDVDATGQLSGTTLTIGNGDEKTATFNNSGNVQFTVLNIEKDGTFNNNNASYLASANTLNLKGGTIEVNSGRFGANTSNLDAGKVKVATGATYIASDLTVGNGDGDPKTAEFINDGTLSGLSKLIVKSDGYFKTSTDTSVTNSIKLEGGEAEVSGGTTSTPTVTLDAGTLTVATGATLAATTSITVGNGDDKTATLTQNGTITTPNLTVNSDGVYTNTGSLTVNDTLQLNGGTIDLANGSTTRAATTAIAEGQIDLKSGAQLITPNLKVGDANGDPNTAKFNNAGELEAETVTVEKDGQFTNATNLALSNALVVNGGNVALTGGKTTAPNTMVNEGTLSVGADAQLEGGAITVGDGDTDEAWLKADGSVKGSTIDVASDGHFEVGMGGTATSTGETTLNGGEITVSKGGTLNVGEATSPAQVGTEKLVVNKGTLNVNGDVNARNITSDTAQAGDEDDAKILVGATGHVTLNPVDNDPLLEGLDPDQGDVFQLDGRLTVNTQPNVHATQANTAKIAGSGTLEKTGEGELTLTADNTFKTVDASDGTLNIDTGSTLTTETLNVGNGDSKESTVNLKGNTNAQHLTIKDDGTLNVGDNTGTPTNLVVDDAISMMGGDFNVFNGSSVKTPNIVTPDQLDEKASTVHVYADATLQLSPADGSSLFENFKTENGKDSIIIDGLLDLTVPEGSTITQDPQTPFNGSGSFEKKGGGRFNVGANNPFAGTVELRDGETHIMEGGKLGNATVNVHAPSTLSVDKGETALKSLTLDSGATLRVVATPEGYTKIKVTDDVHLAGKLFTDIAGSREEDLKNGSFEDVLSTQHGTIQGNFEKYDDNSELFEFVPYITDDKKHMGLTPYAATGEHSLIAIANRLGAQRALGAARTLDESFNLSPDKPLSRLFYSISDPEQAMSALLQSLPTLSGASSQIVADSSQKLAQMSDQRMDCASHSGPNVWAKTYGAWSRQGAYLGASGYHGDSFGIAAGSDVCMNQSRLGFMVGYGNDFVESRQFLTKQTVRADTIQAGMYGSTPLNEQLDVDFKAGVGYSFISTKRDIDFAHKQAEADLHSTLAYAGVGLQALVINTDYWQVRPFVRMDYLVVHNRSYEETGADVLNLHADSGNYQTLVAQTGVKLRLQVADKVNANALVAVGYNLLKDKPSTHAAFEGDRDRKFTTEGATHGRISGQFGLDLSYQVTPAARLSVGYDLMLRPNYVQHVPNVSFKYSF